MDEFPLEILVHIFQYLNKKEQIQVSKVNKKFRETVFATSLWTELEKSIEIPASQMKSFRKFLKQTPRIRYLNLLVSKSKNKPSSIVNLARVFKNLNNLECLSLQFNRCKPSLTIFPSTLKHILLVDCSSVETGKFITDCLLISIADSCPQLELIQIKSHSVPLYTRFGLTYLLNKVKGTLQTLILSVPNNDSSVFYFSDCPPNLTTLCSNVFFREYSEDQLKLPNLENLQILAIADYDEFIVLGEDRCFSTILVNCSLNNLSFLYLNNIRLPFSNAKVYAKFTKLPNLQAFYLDNCHFDIDVLVRFIKDCLSLKVLIYVCEIGYSDEEMSELEKLKTERPIKIYLNGTANATDEEDFFILLSFPDAVRSLSPIMMFPAIFDLNFPNFFKCHSPVISKCKQLFGSESEKSK